VTSAARRTVRTSAPLRVCDLGGWTDTWFAGRGVVCNVAVSPRAHVELRAEPAHDRDHDRDQQLILDATGLPGPHPLLEAVVAEVGAPPGLTLEIHVHCEAPPGSSTGTSASVSVAVAAAVDALSPQAKRRTPTEIAAVAHRAEHVRLGRQSGIQDQLAAAFGGINWIEMTAFPEAKVTPLAVSPATRKALDDRLRVVFLGQPHDSASVHEQVIAELEGGALARLEPLRQCAVAGRDALLAGDLTAYGRALIANTEAQGQLHPALIGSAAQAVIDVARAAGAVGWKVNGAGGDGGSVSVLGDGRVDPAPALQEAGWTLIPTRLCADGLRVEEVADAR
jgi:D-glycero-alpha-D-manno-heptose-7-phosphate kinase